MFRPRHTVPAFAATIARSLPLLVLAGACGPGTLNTPRPAPMPTANACELIPPPTRPADALDIALLDPVNPAHAPVPANESEQFLFGALYETLVSADCTGAPRPALARAWSHDSSGRQWTFTLRDGAQFSDGPPVTAAAVIAAWRAHADTSADRHTSANDRAILGAAAERSARVLAEHATAVDDRTLTVTLPESHDSPLLFAAPALAIARDGGRDAARGPTGAAAATAMWPASTGRYRIASATATSVTLTPTSGGPRLVFRLAPRADARDLLDAHADLVIANTPAATQYALTQPQLAVAPLAWSRTYVLLLPGGARAAAVLAATGTVAPVDVVVFRNGLATAVHADARGALPPFWWASSDSTRTTNGSAASELGRASTPPAAQARIVYDASDPVARDLAERLVALASRGRSAPDSAAVLPSPVAQLLGDARSLQAAPVDGSELARSAAAGHERGYVLALPRRVGDPALARRTLATMLPWLDAARDSSTAIIPLVDTRRAAIGRRGLVGLTEDWFATPEVNTTIVPAAAPVPPPVRTP